MGKPKDPETSWYIEWFGGHTLEKLAEASSAEENCGRGVRCADGKPHNLWSVPYDVIRSFRSSRKPTAARLQDLVQE